MGSYGGTLALALALMTGVLVGCRPGEDGPSKVESVETAPWVGSKAPDFRLPALTGGEWTLSRLRGKVVLINFWATWCIPCRAEMPAMERLYRDVRDQGFEIVGISIDLPESAAVRSFVEERNLSYPVLLDPELAVDELYRVQVVPTTLLIDREGSVAYRFVGARDWNEADSRRMVNRLLSGK
jgi:peroxiredoxin